MNYDVVIVGAGHAGAQAAISLRQQKFEGSIAIIGDEPEFPYERPPLSKEYFAGEKPFERIMIRPEIFWQERDVVMLLSTRIVSVNPQNRTVRTNSGSEIGYSNLIWAAGASPRKLSLPGFTLEGIHYLRNRSDVDPMIENMDAVQDIIVVGGGYIGLEAAAVLRKIGKKVTVLEALDRVLARVAGEPLSRFYESEHRSQGVKILLGQNILEAFGEDKHVTGVRLLDGHEEPAQMVIVGIGVEPAVQPLIDAGAEGSNGVYVDEYCRTSLVDTYAIGDCAAHSNAYAGNEEIRLESVQNANDQAKTAASAICGNPLPYDAVPWFWSNQYDLKLQTVGLFAKHDDFVIRGEMSARSFSVVYMREGRVTALDCVNSVRDCVQGKALIESRKIVSRDQLKSASALKDLLK
ncbi:NAD(P)/FAD-dependent oxidoreductase [Parasphingorhabdus sp.]|uniref:NAD(P)/FAD-dependent oxidoreductase n=1 Tax=Parasphingorhabdus sp. TaxID=2709688 RepID=UPI003BAFD370